MEAVEPAPRARLPWVRVLVHFLSPCEVSWTGCGLLRLEFDHRSPVSKRLRHQFRATDVLRCPQLLRLQGIRASECPSQAHLD